MNQVALEKFYEALEKVKDLGWQVWTDGTIRAKTSDQYPDCWCPLEAADPNHKMFIHAGRAFGFTDDEAWAITEAADWISKGSRYSPAIRARMLEILQLKEIE